jgi:hypothetical protein
MRTVYQTLYSQGGNQLEVLDYKLLQQELQNLESTNIGMQAALNDLMRKVEALQAQTDATQAFYGYVASQYPHILDEYRIREAAKAKVCPPPPSDLFVNMDMQQLELRTLAAIGKLP